MRLKDEIRKKDKQIADLKELLREYKNEWEAACERWRASNERVKELEDCIKRAKRELM